MTFCQFAFFIVECRRVVHVSVARGRKDPDYFTELPPHTSDWLKQRDGACVLELECCCVSECVSPSTCVLNCAAVRVETEVWQRGCWVIRLSPCALKVAALLQTDLFIYIQQPSAERLSSRRDRERDAEAAVGRAPRMQTNFTTVSQQRLQTCRDDEKETGKESTVFIVISFSGPE